MEEGVFKMVYTRTIHWRYVEWRKEICRIEEGGIYNGERGYVEYRKEVCRISYFIFLFNYKARDNTNKKSQFTM